MATIHPSSHAVTNFPKVNTRPQVRVLPQDYARFELRIDLSVLKILVVLLLYLSWNAVSVICYLTRIDSANHYSYNWYAWFRRIDCIFWHWYFLSFDNQCVGWFLLSAPLYEWNWTRHTPFMKSEVIGQNTNTLAFGVFFSFKG